MQKQKCRVIHQEITTKPSCKGMGQQRIRKLLRKWNIWKQEQQLFTDQLRAGTVNQYKLQRDTLIRLFHDQSLLLPDQQGKTTSYRDNFPLLLLYYKNVFSVFLIIAIKWFCTASFILVFCHCVIWNLNHLTRFYGVSSVGDAVENCLVS